MIAPNIMRECDQCGTLNLFFHHYKTSSPVKYSRLNVISSPLLSLAQNQRVLYRSFRCIVTGRLAAKFRSGKSLQ